MNKKNRNPTTPALRDLADSIGEFIQYWGFRKIHGQVWTLVYLSRDPLHATEIVQRLGVSKALVSLALRELAEFRLVEITSKPGRKVKTYVANPNVFAVICDVLRSRELVILHKVSSQRLLLQKTLTAKESEALINPARMHELDEMIQSAQTALAGILSLSALSELKDLPFSP